MNIGETFEQREERETARWESLRKANLTGEFLDGFTYCPAPDPLNRLPKPLTRINGKIVIKGA